MPPPVISVLVVSGCDSAPCESRGRFRVWMLHALGFDYSDFDFGVTVAGKC